MPRSLSAEEIRDLLTRDLVARLATVDAAGFPHVTPIWFLWTDGTFRMTSYTSRPHVRRALTNSRVGLVVDDESALRNDGERPNRQVRVVGLATVMDDTDYEWTSRIRRRYIGEFNFPSDRSPTRHRSVIELEPNSLVAVASV
jgi:nitroimidazol reductase NimA-like FMN-containing flavoprotein (pyridoxamine 5'-phosphate oxidase superfamily)